MSRIGRKPIPVPDGVTVKVEPEAVHVTSHVTLALTVNAAPGSPAELRR